MFSRLHSLVDYAYRARGLTPPDLPDELIAATLAAGLPTREAEALERITSRLHSFGVTTLNAVALASVPDAVALLLRGRVPSRLFDDVARQLLASAYASIAATSELLGQARVRELQAIAVANRGEPAPDEPFISLGGILSVLTPAAAVELFLSLFPALAIGDGFARRHTRRAMAIVTLVDRALLLRIDNIVRAQPAASLGAILNDAGLHPSDPRYANFIFRSEITEQFNRGGDLEYRQADVREVFPVWRYRGIRDNRTGDDHRPKIGRYYPAAASFVEVRGPRYQNCRCSPQLIDRWTWERLKSRGAKIEVRWDTHYVSS